MRSFVSLDKKKILCKFSVLEREARMARRKAGADEGAAVSAAGMRLLGRVMAAGQAGLRSAPAGPTAELESRGLVRDSGEGGLVATAEGAARLARAQGGFLAQHRALGRRSVPAEGGGFESALVDLDESPLGWLARRKGRDGKPLLAPHEVAAGERLRADFTRGQMTPRVTANWEASVSRGRRGGAGAGAELSDHAMAARDRVRRAIEAVGPELSGALLDVCCFLKGMEEVERDRGWPARGAKLVLGLALSRLARHYGYAPDEPAPDRPGRIVRWGTADSRPTIDGAEPQA